MLPSPAHCAVRCLSSVEGFITATELAQSADNQPVGSPMERKPADQLQLAGLKFSLNRGYGLTRLCGRLILQGTVPRMASGPSNKNYRPRRDLRAEYLLFCG
jgi:hypothetical protein